MSAANLSGGTVAVAAEGTTLALSDDQNLTSFAANRTNTAFSIPSSGTYLVSFRVSTTTGAMMTVGVLQNNAVIPASIVSPTVSTSEFMNTFIADLIQGDELKLQLSGMTGNVVLQSGVGAYLMAVRVN